MAELGRIEIPSKFPNDESVTVVNVPAKSGNHVRKGEVLVDVEFSKATVELESPCDGYVALLYGLGDEVSIGSPVAIIFSEQEEAVGLDIEKGRKSLVKGTPLAGERKLSNSPPPAHHSHLPSLDMKAVQPSKTIQLFSRAALSRLNELGRSVDEFSEKPFIRLADIEGNSGKSAATAEDDSPLVPSSKEKLSALKGAEIANLMAGQNTITSNFQKTINMPLQDMSASVGTAFSSMLIVPKILKQCSRLLKEFPLLNAYLGSGVINVYETVSIGYAIDLGSGLRILSLGDVEQLDENEIKIKISAGVKAYMMNRLDPNEARRSTFIVTDLSNEGVDYFVPLLGKNQSATLGICAVDPTAGSVKVSLTFDHRVTEGRMVANFLRQMATGLT